MTGVTLYTGVYPQKEGEVGAHESAKRSAAPGDCRCGELCPTGLPVIPSSPEPVTGFRSGLSGFEVRA